MFGHYIFCLIQLIKICQSINKLFLQTKTMYYKRVNKKVIILFIPLIIIGVVGLALVVHGVLLLSKTSAPITTTNATSTTPNTSTTLSALTIGAAAFQVEIADSTSTRAQGLSGHAPLADNQGMLFLFPISGNYGFWMKDMQFALDMIWIKDNTVVGFAENAQPQPGAALWNLKVYYPPKAIDKVLEVNAGTVQKDGIKVGDTVSL